MDAYLSQGFFFIPLSKSKETGLEFELVSLSRYSDPLSITPLAQPVFPNGFSMTANGTD